MEFLIGVCAIAILFVIGMHFDYIFAFLFWLSNKLFPIDR